MAWCLTVQGALDVPLRARTDIVEARHELQFLSLTGVPAAVLEAVKRTEYRPRCGRVPEDVSPTTNDVRLHEPATAHGFAVRDPMHEWVRPIKEDRFLFPRIHVGRERVELHHASRALLLRRDLRMARRAEKAQVAHGIVASEVDWDDMVDFPSRIATQDTHSIALVD